MLLATCLVSGGKLSFLFWFVFANTVNTVWDLRCQHSLPCVNSNQHTCTHHHTSTNLITRSTTGLNKNNNNVTLCFPQRVFWVVANCWCNLWGSESPHAKSTNQKSTGALSWPTTNHGLQSKEHKSSFMTNDEPLHWLLVHMLVSKWSDPLCSNYVVPFIWISMDIYWYRGNLTGIDLSSYICQ